MKNYKEETPPNIEELKSLAADRTSYENRLDAVEQLGNYKCRQSIDILWRRMISDKVYLVQETAFRKLQAFGEDVKLPKKQPGHLVKDINKKLARVKNALPDVFTPKQFRDKFQQLYPVEFDIYSYEKKHDFDGWIKNVLSSLPKIEK